MTDATLAAANAQQRASAGWFGMAGGVSGVGVAAGGAVATESVGGIHRTVLTLDAVAVTITQASSAGFGSLKVYDLPAGLIQILGAVMDLALVAAAGIGATATVAGALGTDATADETLGSGEVNVVPSTNAVLASSAGALKAKSTATQMAAGVFDGTTTAKDLVLNLALAAGVTGNSTLTVSGTIVVTWVNLGDV